MAKRKGTLTAADAMRQVMAGGVLLGALRAGHVPAYDSGVRATRIVTRGALVESSVEPAIAPLLYVGVA